MGGRLAGAAALLLVCCVGCDGEDEDGGGGGGDDFTETVSSAICAPTAGGFSSTIDHPFFPLQPGSVSVLEGEDDEGVALRLELHVPDETELVAGVETRVLEEREFEDGALVEISRNFFARASDGTLCYFGEDVDDYEDGAIVGHSGAWRAGVAGALPGVFLPAEPEVGMRFRQELAPGVAEDRAEVVAVGEPVDTPAGRFTDTVELLETTPLEPGVESTKIYVRGQGLAVDDDVRLLQRTPVVP